MNLLRINKYILAKILSHLKCSKELNIMRYNKKLQSKLDISLYSYQKKYFETIMTPALLNNTEILLQNNIFDKKTLDKLKFDLINETTETLQEKDCFHFDQKTNSKNLKDIKILNISLKNQNLLKKSAPNLIELNISDIKNLEIPCSLLLNLETFSLENISKLKFINKEENISLNKLKHLYLNNVSFNKENKIKISLNNLKYLDLRLKEQEGEAEGDPEETEFDNDNNKAGFLKEKTLKHLISIFNFKFLSVFKNDSNESENGGDEGSEDGGENEEMEDEEFPMDKYDELVFKFKKSNELFDKKYLSNYDYFNLEILYEFLVFSGAADYQGRFIDKYFFAKTKGNKYIFKTEYTNFANTNGEYEEVFNKEVRYCYDMNYNDYYFINNEAEIGGDDFLEDILNFDSINSYSIVSKHDAYSYKLIKSLENFKKDKNKLEILSIEDLDLSFADSILKNLKSLNNLKCFYITKDFIFKNNKELIDLFTALSKIKTLFLIDITIKNELKLNKNDENKIKKILPNIIIKKEKKESSIKWHNNNYKL